MSSWILDDVYSDDEDDTAELLAELERIKKERAEDKLRKVLFGPYEALYQICSSVLIQMLLNEDEAEF